MKCLFKHIALCVLLCLVLCMGASALSKIGSSGEQVSEIQAKLKKWGYYQGAVDGIFGTATKNAVIKFQKANNLTADGVVGNKTLKALGIDEKEN